MGYLKNIDRFLVFPCLFWATINCLGNENVLTPQSLGAPGGAPRSGRLLHIKQLDIED